jgi:Integrin alpha
LDGIHRRAFFDGSNKNIEIDSMKLTSADRCKNYNLKIQGNLEEIFIPILVDMTFELKEKIPENETKFCDTCFVLNPHDFNSISKNISFHTGCKETKCLTDLSVVGKLSNAKNPYAFNSTDSIDIIYEIQNHGEPAYYSQMNITIPTNITKFKKTPSTCQVDNNVLSCNITSSNPIRREKPVELKISLETSHLKGDLLSVHANVFSRGDDKNLMNNNHQFNIGLMEYSEIELNG